MHLRLAKTKTRRNKSKIPKVPEEEDVLMPWPEALGLSWSWPQSWHCTLCPLPWNPGSSLLWYPTICHLARQGTPQTTKTLGLFGMVDSSRLCVIQGPDWINQTALNSWLWNWWVKIFNPGIWLDSLFGEGPSMYDEVLSSLLEWSNCSVSEKKYIFFLIMSIL